MSMRIEGEGSGSFPEKNRKLRSSWITPLFCLVVTSLALAACTPQEAQPNVNARITSPTSGSVVPSEFFEAEGTVTGLRDKETLWVIVDNQLELHPQRAPVIIVAGTSKWHRPGVRVASDPSPQCLMLATATESATRTLNMYITDGDRTGNFPGLDGLPSGVAFVDGVRVCVTK